VDENLARWVAEELRWDTQVDNAAIVVRALDGCIVLRGRVRSAREKLDAESAARRVDGVAAVVNELKVGGAAQAALGPITPFASANITSSARVSRPSFRIT
jgi:hypothetical protein